MSKYTVEDWKRIMIDMCPVIRDPHHPEAPVKVSFDLILLDKNRNSESTALPADVEIWNESDRNRLFGTLKEGDSDGQK